MPNHHIPLRRCRRHFQAVNDFQDDVGTKGLSKGHCRGGTWKLWPSPIAKMVSLTDFQRIGVGLVGFGIFFILFGVLLYFDSVLLAFGNILFLSGLVFIIGFRRTFTFFFQRPKLKGTSFFLGGVIIVLMRWPILGMLLEAYGFITLFRSFFPVAFGFFGSLVNIPVLSKLLQKVGDSSSMV